jgi:hypothetical protein
MITYGFRKRVDAPFEETVEAKLEKVMAAIGRRDRYDRRGGDFLVRDMGTYRWIGNVVQDRQVAR